MFTVNTQKMRKTFLETMKGFVVDSKQLERTNYMARTKLKPITRASKRDIARSVLITMPQKLGRKHSAGHEAADQIDQVAVDFSIGVDYIEMQIEAIKERHDR